jgi:hypothetical protein
VPNLNQELGRRCGNMKNKVLIIKAKLVHESWGKTNEELEAEIKTELNPRDIPWVEKIEEVKVLSES